MMKKTIYAATTVGVLAFGGMVFANTDSAENTASQPQNAATAKEGRSAAASEGKLLSFEEASKKALEVADGTITDIELDDNDKSKPHFEVDIHHGGYGYEFKLEAVRGEVLKQKSEKEDKDSDAGKAMAGGGLLSPC